MATHPCARLAFQLSLIGLVLVAVLPGDAFAGPGGEIAELLFKTKLGRIVMGLLVIVFLPLIVYIYAREAVGVHRTKKDLRILAERLPWFEWRTIEARVSELATYLYREWNKGKLVESRAFMTSQYAQSQQDILDRWSEEGKRNVTKLRKIKKIKPLRVQVENEEQMTAVHVLLTLDLIDYLEQVRTGKVLKGKKKVIEAHDVVFVMVHAGSSGWLLHSIGDGSLSLALARKANVTDTSYLERIGRMERVPSEAPVLDSTADVPATDAEEPGVKTAHHEQGE